MSCVAHFVESALLGENMCERLRELIKQRSSYQSLNTTVLSILINTHVKWV